MVAERTSEARGSPSEKKDGNGRRRGGRQRSQRPVWANWQGKDRAFEDRGSLRDSSRETKNREGKRQFKRGDTCELRRETESSEAEAVHERWRGKRQISGALSEGSLGESFNFYLSLFPSLFSLYCPLPRDRKEVAGAS